MSSHQMNNEHAGSSSAFITGFIISLALTILAFVIIGYELASGALAIVIISLLALLQLSVQLVFFLHLGRESKPRWNGKMFAFTAVMILILVVGTIWVMNNLDYNMSSGEAAEYLLEDEGIKR